MKILLALSLLLLVCGCASSGPQVQARQTPLLVRKLDPKKIKDIEDVRRVFQEMNIRFVHEDGDKAGVEQMGRMKDLLE